MWVNRSEVYHFLEYKNSLMLDSTMHFPAVPHTLLAAQLSTLTLQAQLRDVSFIPVANASRLVPPSALVQRAKSNLAPFVYEVPLAFAKFGDLLKGLGAKPAPSAKVQS